MTQDTDETDAFEGFILVGRIHNIAAPAGIGLLTVKHVHYPGSQQLIVWLPQSGYDRYADFVLTDAGERVIEHTPVRSRLNGSVQFLTDTLPWRPGLYRIEISHEDGWRHVVDLEKLAEGMAAPAPEPPPRPPAEPSSEPRIYRDGAGNIIPNLDVELRKQAIEDLSRRFGRRLEYEGSYRAGVVIYVDGARRIRFSHEMAAAPYKFMIDVPPAAAWEAATGAPLSERDDIIRFLAEQVQREQASTWTFEIRETEILFR